MARLGGDEFTLLLPGHAPAPRTRPGWRRRSWRRCARPSRWTAASCFVTASIGISLYPDDGEDAETLLKNADTAMYRAKEQGRDSYQLYAARA